MKTAARQIALLRLTPLSDSTRVQWVPTTEIVEKLKAAGHVCTKRTVQRDLNDLADAFDLDVRGGDGNTEHQWSRHKSLEAA